MEPIQVLFLDMPRSEAVEKKIEQRAARLAKFCPDLMTCRVWIDSPNGHHRKGPFYRVRLRLTVPSEEIDIELQPEEEDVHVSIREAFDAARRKLEDYERRRRGERKAHPRSRGDRSRRRLVLARAERG